MIVEFYVIVMDHESVIILLFVSQFNIVIKKKCTSEDCNIPIICIPFESYNYMYLVIARRINPLHNSPVLYCQIVLS